MARSNITFSKGGLSVTLHTVEINDNFNNKLFLITPPQTKANQESGKKDTKIVDLLRITHQLIVRGWIQTKSEKDDLISIAEGGGTAGGTVSMVYDGDTISGFIETMNFTDRPQDEPNTAPDDFARYEAQITFVDGSQI